eukprot:74059-Amphidinium_carterae.1
MVPSPYPTTYPLQYMICGDCLYPKDATQGSNLRVAWLDKVFNVHANRKRLYFVLATKKKYSAMYTNPALLLNEQLRMVSAIHAETHSVASLRGRWLFSCGCWLVSFQWGIWKV